MVQVKTMYLVMTLLTFTIDTPEDWHVIEDQMKQQMLLMAEQVLGEDQKHMKI